MSSSRILIATGGEAIHEFLGSILRADGFEVLVVASTDEAISHAAQFAPDTLIIETIMPGEVDGLRTAMLIAKETNCKVLFLEGMHDYLSVSYCNALRREIPDCDILPMPFEKDEVLAIAHRRVTGWSIAERLRSEAEAKRTVSQERRNESQFIPSDHKANDPSYQSEGASWLAPGIIGVLLVLYIALVLYAPHQRTLTEGERATLNSARFSVAQVLQARLAGSSELGEALDAILAQTHENSTTGQKGATSEGKLSAPSAVLRIEPRGGNNVYIYLRKSDFETVLNPDRKEFVTAVGKAWCDNTGEDSHWLLPAVYIGDIRTGEELASYSCVFDSVSW